MGKGTSPSRVGGHPPPSGIYVLWVRVNRPHWLKVPGRWNLRVPAGYYAYVGRAARGLAPGVNRHFRRAPKRRFWHIYHLLDLAEPVEAWVYPLGDGE